MTTRRELIRDKYNEFMEKSKHLIKDKYISLLPPVDELDICDLVFYLSSYFQNPLAYKNELETILKLNKIDFTKKEFDEFYIYFFEFIDWFKKLT